MRKNLNLIGIGLLFAVLSCSPLRHYKAVAEDPQRSEEKRSILAPICAEEFPNIKSVDSSIKIEVEYVRGKVDKGTSFVLSPSSKVIAMSQRIDTVLKKITTKIHTKEIDSAYTRVLEQDLKKAFSRIDDYSKDLLSTKLERDELKKGKENIGTLLLWVWQAIRWWLLAFMVIIIIYKTQNIWLKGLSWIKSL